MSSLQHFWLNLLSQFEDSSCTFKFAMQLAIISNQDKTTWNWDMAELRWYIADRNNFLDCLHSIACVVRKHITDFVIFIEEILNGKLHFRAVGLLVWIHYLRKFQLKLYYFGLYAQNVWKTFSSHFMENC